MQNPAPAPAPTFIWLRNLWVKTERLRLKIHSKRSVIGWLVLTIIAIMLPIMLDLVLCLLINDFTRFDLVDRLLHGELYIYSISLLAPILFITSIALKSNLDLEVKKNIPYIGSITLLFVNIILYCIVNTLVKMNPCVNISFFSIGLSVLFFIGAIIFAYRMRIFEDTMNTFDARENSNNDNAQLNEQVDRLNHGRAVPNRQRGREDGQLDEGEDDE